MLLKVFVVLLFYTHSTSSVEIAYQGLANLLLQAVNNFTSVVQVGESDVATLLGFESGSSTVNIAPEVADLPKTINFLVAALDEFQYFFLRLFNGLNKVIKENKSSYKGLQINIPIQILQPYLNAYDQVAKDIGIVANNVQVFISLIETFVSPQFKESPSSSHVQLSAPASFASEFNATVHTLANSISNAGSLILNASQESSDAIAQLSTPGIAGQVMNAVNSYASLIAQDFMEFSGGFISEFLGSSILDEVSSNTFNFNVQKLLIRLNTSLVTFKDFLLKSLTDLSAISSILKLVADVGQL